MKRKTITLTKIISLTKQTMTTSGKKSENSLKNERRDKMTIADLKKEADKLGYRLCKKTKYIKFLPCRCGKKYPEVWFTYNGVFYQCPKCENIIEVELDNSKKNK